MVEQRECTQYAMHAPVKWKGQRRWTLGDTGARVGSHLQLGVSCVRLRRSRWLLLTLRVRERVQLALQACVGAGQRHHVPRVGRRASVQQTEADDAGTYTLHLVHLARCLHRR